MSQCLGRVPNILQETTINHVCFNNILVEGYIKYIFLQLRGQENTQKSRLHERKGDDSRSGPSLSDVEMA